MIDSEVRAFIVREIQRHMQIIGSGTAGNTTMTTEDIQTFMPGAPTVPARPVSQPFGFASRAPQGMLSVTAQQGEHPGNKVTLGHRDKDAPEVAEGESVIYSKGGYRMVVKNGELFVGKGTDLEHVVVGETLKAFLIGLVDAIIAHDHLGNLGFPTSVPRNNATFTQLKTDNLDNDKILAKDGGRY